MRLGEVPLLLHEAALPRPEAERQVLQGALAAPVADRAVERVVDEEELEHTLLGLLHARASAVLTTIPSVTVAVQAGGRPR